MDDARQPDRFSLNTPRGYHIWNVKCLYSFRDDLLEVLDKTTIALECKTSTSSRRSSLKNVFFKLTFNTFREGLIFLFFSFFLGEGGGGVGGCGPHYQVYCLQVVGPTAVGDL